jgi:hypothetical protein
MYPAVQYLPLRIWNVGTTEAVYQPVQGQRLVTAQLWIADRAVAADCMNIPNL